MTIATIACSDAIATAPAVSGRAAVTEGEPMRILVFDSGVGGLSVAREIAAALPAADLAYVADTAVFPYGGLDPEVLVDRVVMLMEAAVAALRPAALVIACNTASTLVLPPLRARLSIPVVGTVPAVKPAAESSVSRMVSVLATPGTVKRDYTRDLIAAHGGDCRFTLVGSADLAALVERVHAGEDVPDDAFAATIAPCFVTAPDGRRTDTVVLACTHYPLVLDRLGRLAPWPVAWIDPAPAIARRTAAVTAEEAPRHPARAPLAPHGFFATGRLPDAAFLARFGFAPARAFDALAADGVSAV